MQGPISVEDSADSNPSILKHSGSSQAPEAPALARLRSKFPPAPRTTPFCPAAGSSPPRPVSSTFCPRYLSRIWKVHRTDAVAGPSARPTAALAVAGRSEPAHSSDAVGPSIKRCCLDQKHSSGMIHDVQARRKLPPRPRRLGFWLSGRPVAAANTAGVANERRDRRRRPPAAYGPTRKLPSRPQPGRLRSRGQRDSVQLAGLVSSDGGVTKGVAA